MSWVAVDDIEAFRETRLKDGLADAPCHVQETLNYWKQLPHVLKYFREKENPTVKLPENFIQGFLEVHSYSQLQNMQRRHN